MMVIKVPPKVWRPKVKNKYFPLVYSNDLDEGVCGFDKYRKKVYKP